jgi:hypothetical protein
MEADDFTVHRILGLSHRNDPTAFGWLCVCKTRAGNSKFFEWYTSSVMTSFVGHFRELLPEDQREDSFYMTADGESLQTAPVQNDEVMKKLVEFNINLGKGPASCTNTIGNACD